MRQLEIVGAHRILFSHHSVGANILQGISDLDEPVRHLRAAPLEGAASLVGPAFLHTSGGTNKDPRSKIDHFASTIRALETLPDAAMMKLCYVDLNPHTDVEALWAYYRDALAAVARERPAIAIAHMTVPLVRRPSRAKDRLYRLIGREVWEDASNVKRHLFSQRLLETYGPARVFDLALVESTAPNGDRTTFSHQGNTYFSLYPGYTEDGGHLNTVGSRTAAAGLLVFFAELLTDRART